MIQAIELYRLYDYEGILAFEILPARGLAYGHCFHMKIAQWYEQCLIKCAVTE